MTLLATGSLTYARRVTQSAMPDTAQVERPTTTPDGMGGRTQTWPVIGTYPCRIGKSAPSIGLQGEVVQFVNQIIVTLPYNTDARAGDRLVVTSQSNRLLRVIGGMASVDFGVELPLQCQEIT